MKISYYQNFPKTRSARDVRIWQIAMQSGQIQKALVNPVYRQWNLQAGNTPADDVHYTGNVNSHAGGRTALTGVVGDEIVPNPLPAHSCSICWHGRSQRLIATGATPASGNP